MKAFSSSFTCHHVTCHDLHVMGHVLHATGHVVGHVTCTFSPSRRWLSSFPWSNLHSKRCESTPVQGSGHVTGHDTGHVTGHVTGHATGHVPRPFVHPPVTGTRYRPYYYRRCPCLRRPQPGRDLG
eukprot:2801186-Rhodomonas_salina.1